MTAQATILAALDEFREVGQSVELDPDLLERGDECHTEIERFQVLIPLVGAFNAGKTSLVNALLKRGPERGLPTDIVPQTALATEIRAAEESEGERIELYGEADELLEQVDIEQFQRIEKETLKTGQPKALYAKALLHAPGLEQIDRKILVDMPGLDSGLRTHNAAIQRYLPRGSYFLMVVDADHGTLRASEIRQLREFLDQDVEFAVLVNKIDKKQTDADAIIGEIEKQVESAFGKSAPIRAVSAHSDDVTAFHDVLAGVDFDRALATFWRARVCGLFDNAERSLHTRYSALNVSTAESDRLIAELQAKKGALENKLRSDEREIGRRYSDRAVDRIIQSVRDAIRDQARALAETYMAGGQSAFEHEVNEIVRQTLNRTVEVAQSETLSEIAERYREDIDGLNASYEQLGSSRDAEISSGGRPALIPALGDAARKSMSAARGAKIDTSKGVLTATAFTGVLAATTAIVAPWLEALIIALPSILGWLKERSERQRQEEERQRHFQDLQMNIRSQVASKVASEMRAKVASHYSALARDMMDQLRQHVGALVDGVEKDIRKSQAEVEAQQKDVEQRKSALKDALGALTKAKQPIEALL